MSDFRGTPEDDIINRIESGKMLAEIARGIECPASSLLAWLDATPERSARASRARQLAAGAWDDKAEREIEAARDPFELAKAKEKAHHYRWRATKIGGSEYRDKTVLTGPGDQPLQTGATISLAGLTPEALRALAGIRLPNDASE